MKLSTMYRKHYIMLASTALFCNATFSQIIPTDFILGRLESQVSTNYNIQGFGGTYAITNNYFLNYGKYNADSTGFNRIVKLFKISGESYSLTKAVPGAYPFSKVVVNRYGSSPEIKTTALFEVIGTPSSAHNSQIHIVPDYVGTMEELINSYVINRGSDNTFVRGVSGATVNNITRIDLILEEPVLIPFDLDSRNKSGFLIMERGGNDRFTFGAITSINASDTTANTFGPVVPSLSTIWGSSGQNINSIVMQKSGTDLDLKPSQNIGAQSISGTFISLENLEVEAGTLIYGISIAGTNATSFTSFPSTAPDTDGNGLDFMAGGGFFTKAFLINGKVWNDINGDAIPGSGELGLANNLWANLVDNDGNVISSVLVSTNGSYQLFIAEQLATDINYSIILTNQEYFEGDVLTEAETLQNDYLFTGTNFESIADTNNKSGKIDIGIIDSDKNNIDFGIQLPPSAGSQVLTSVLNPGSTNNYTIPSTSFLSNDPDGVINKIRIEAFPDNLTSITIGSITYTLEDWPEEGVEITTNSLGAPTESVMIDPIDGDVITTLVFSVQDNAGVWSASTGSLQIPFHSFSIAGNVLHDPNGLTDGIVNGTGTNLDNSLYAYLVDATLGTILNKVAVNPDGTYSFSQVGGGYEYAVHISSVSLTVGDDMPSSVFPTGWAAIGEHIGSDEGDDGNPNGVLFIGTISNHITQVNFGLQNPPIANNSSTTITTPTPGLVLELDGIGDNLPIPTAEDFEDGAMGSGGTIRFVTLPTNTTLWYDGALVEENVPIENFDPSLLQIEFGEDVVGITFTSFEFEYQDAAGTWPQVPGIYQVDWSSPLNINFVKVDANLTHLGNAKIFWEVSSPENIASYQVEYYFQNDWKTLSSIPAALYIQSQNNIFTYQYLHLNPRDGVNIYRIKSTAENGVERFSNTVKLEVHHIEKLQLLPNPAFNTIHLKVINPSEIQSLQIIDVTGKIVWSANEYHAAIDISNLSSGNYTLQASWQNQSTERTKFVKQ